jgi:hypothetical protein
MTNRIFFRCSTLLATMLLAFGLVTRVQAQSTGSFALLNDAYATLAQAKHDYKGHRVRAMKQIEAALGELGEKISEPGDQPNFHCAGNTLENMRAESGRGSAAVLADGQRDVAPNFKKKTRITRITRIDTDARDGAGMGNDV